MNRTNPTRDGNWHRINGELVDVPLNPPEAPKQRRSYTPRKEPQPEAPIHPAAVPDTTE